jgi:hypothetical protein
MLLILRFSPVLSLSFIKLDLELRPKRYVQGDLR